MKIRTVGRTDMKVIVAFRNFAKAPKKLRLTFKPHFINAHVTQTTHTAEMFKTST
jgi:hypothetical protein